MKTLYLVRHAKAEDVHGDDKERSLNDEGKKDLKRMATFLRDKDIALDRICSSTAKRCRKTAKKFAKKLGLNKEKDIALEEKLYMSSAKVLRQYIRALPKDVSAVMIVAHNPWLEELMQSIESSFAHFPTCGVVKLQADMETWNHSDPALRTVEEFRFPKKHHVEEQ